MKSSKGRENLTGEIDLVDQVLQVEKVHVAREVAKQSEEVGYRAIASLSRPGGLVAKVMPADALQRQIEPVPDPPIQSTRFVDRHPAIDLIGWKHDHPADRVADAQELFGVLFGI